MSDNKLKFRLLNLQNSELSYKTSNQTIIKELKSLSLSLRGKKIFNDLVARLTPQLITSENMLTAVALVEIFQTTHKIETDKRRWH